MEQSQIKEFSDPDVRHFIYKTFAETTRPPTTIEVADHFNVPIAAVENVFERLASNHHIALAPGTFSIWMAHPFSGLPTNFVADVGGKKYWGN